MLDFYADWCVSCKEMERFTFTDPAVQRRLAGALLLRADVTANNAEDRELLRRFRLFGPPALIFFDAAGAGDRRRPHGRLPEDVAVPRDARVGRPLRGPVESLLWYTARLSREVEQSGSSLGS